MVKSLLLTIALLFSVTQHAKADSVSITNAECDSFLFLSVSGPAPFAGSPLFTGDGGYSVIWPANSNGLASVTSNVVLAPRGIAGDTFQLTIANENENAWTFEVLIFDGAVQSSGPVSILNATSNTFSFTLSGAFTEVRVVVSGVLPVNGQDRNAEYRIKGVPEPATLALFGAGLLALGGILRRRFRDRRVIPDGYE